jgi:type IV secretory pathway TraG/TraD family ATPase VirD4
MRVQGLHAWILTYGLILVPMYFGLLQRSAPAVRYWTAPFLAVPVQLLAAILIATTQGSIFHWRPSSLSANAFELGGLIVLILTGYLSGLAASRRTSDIVVKRGTVILDGTDAQRRSRRARCNGALTLAGVTIMPLDETKHFKLIGTTGTGKTTAIRELLGAALRRGDRAVIADPDAGYIDDFYDPSRGDVILNPFDPRARRWDLFGELRATYDVEQLARSLIPDHEGSDRIWRSYARTFFTAVTRQLHEANCRQLPELYGLLTSASPEELRLIVRGTPAQPFLEEGNERMFGSIRSVIGAGLTAFEYLANQRADPLSVRRWTREGKGALFLPYQADQIAALRSIISTWMRLAIFERMSQPIESQSPTRQAGSRPGGPPKTNDPLPCWFVVDELDALGQIDGLKDALARLRKFGGRCVLGFQSIAQVSTTYGHGEAQTIVENCGNTLILRCSASETGGTAKFASRLIGDREVIRRQVSKSRSGGFFQDPRTSRSISDQHVTESAVLGSEIEQLPDLRGFLKLASRAEWLTVRLGRD